MQKTLRQMNKELGKFYVELNDEETGMQFLQDAQQEGYRFGDGASPTSREYARLMFVDPNMEIGYVGIAGHIAVGSGAQSRPTVVYEK